MSASATAAETTIGRFVLIPCEAPGCEDLSVVWDRLEEQVIDILSAAEAEAYFPKGAL